jgi:HK97 family phage major capsid protein
MVYMPFLTLGQQERRLQALQSERLVAIAAAREIADRGSRGLPISDSDERAYKRHSAEIDRVGQLITDARADIQDAKEQDEKFAALQSLGKRTGFSSNGSSNSMIENRAAYGRPLGVDQSFADVSNATPRTAEDSGRYIRALLRDDVETRATMLEGTPAAAGNLVPVQYAAPLLDLARAKAQVLRLSTVIPMESQTAKVPVHTGDPVAAWRNEAAAIAESGVTVAAVTLTARSLAVMVRASIELVEDSATDFESYIANVLAQAFAIKLDSTLLYGSGVAPEPRGLMNTAGITTANLGGANGSALTNFDSISDTIAGLRAINVEPNAAVTSPRTLGSLAKIKAAGSGDYLAAPGYVGSVPMVTTSNVPVNLTTGTSADTSDIIVGDFRQMLVGIRDEFSIIVLRERYMDTGEVGFLAMLRADCAVARPASFSALRGVRP